MLHYRSFRTTSSSCNCMPNYCPPSGWYIVDRAPANDLKNENVSIYQHTDNLLVIKFREKSKPTKMPKFRVHQSNLPTPVTGRKSGNRKTNSVMLTNRPRHGLESFIADLERGLSKGYSKSTFGIYDLGFKNTNLHEAGG